MYQEQTGKGFEDIKCWQRAKDLSVKVYSLFRDHRDFGFRDQVQRASVSIMNNIAEGSERNYTKEFRQFLYIAKGSSGEVRSLLCLAKELEYISDTEFNELYSDTIEISRMLAGFIRSL